MSSSGLAADSMSRRRLHFLHIGKTGGTAVKWALRHCAVPHLMLRLHPHGVRLRDVPEGDGVFFFVRHPIGRFVSGFYSRQREGRPRYFSPWTPAERQAFNVFSTPNELALALSSPDPEKRSRGYHAMAHIEHVRRSYWDWFEDERYFESRLADIWFIGFLERLDDDFAVLRTALGLPSAMLPRDDVAAHRNPAHVNVALDEPAIANLKRWYERDFVFLHLCRAFVESNAAGRVTRPPRNECVRA
jgi:hypothetical protein